MDEQTRFEAIYTQNEQIIDILMMILKNSNEDDTSFVDFVHNEKNLFLSNLTEEEFAKVMEEFKEKYSSDEPS